MKRNDFVPAEPHVSLSSGRVIQILRELKGWTQQELCERSGIGITNLSLLENNKVSIGKRRGEQLAKAFDVHPAIIVFPEYEAEWIRRAA